MAKNIQLSAGFLGKGDKLTYEPQRTSSGLIFIRLGTLDLSEIMNIDENDAEKMLALAIDTAMLPSYGVEIIEMGYMNETIKFPGKATVDELTWTVRDFVDVPVADILDAWYTLTFNAKSGAIAYASKYKTTAFALLFGTDGHASEEGDEPKNRWYRMEGAYPSRIERGDIDHSGGDYVRMNVTLTVDRVVPLWLDDMTDSKSAAHYAGDTSVPYPELPVPIV